MSDRWPPQETARLGGWEDASTTIIPEHRRGRDISPNTSEGWEPWLRNQITAHPRVALGAGLLMGLLAGWWVKR